MVGVTMVYHVVWANTMVNITMVYSGFLGMVIQWHKYFTRWYSTLIIYHGTPCGGFGYGISWYTIWYYHTLKTTWYTIVTCLWYIMVFI